MKKIGYARVSTEEQRHDRQVIGLKGLCDELHIETLSARKAKRPVFDAVLAKLARGDMLVVWDLDRAFRSVIDALTVANRLQTRGVHFQVVSLHIDTTTPEGMFAYTMQSALGEYEWRKLSQRTKEGMVAARLAGSRIGRPPRVTEDQVKAARDRIAMEGCTISAAARAMDVPRYALSRALRRDAARRQAAGSPAALLRIRLPSQPPI